MKITQRILAICAIIVFTAGGIAFADCIQCSLYSQVPGHEGSELVRCVSNPVYVYCYYDDNHVEIWINSN